MSNGLRLLACFCETGVTADFADARPRRLDYTLCLEDSRRRPSPFFHASFDPARLKESGLPRLAFLLKVSGHMGSGCCSKRASLVYLHGMIERDFSDVYEEQTRFYSNCFRPCRYSMIRSSFVSCRNPIRATVAATSADHI